MGATVSADQNGWNASVSAGKNSDWTEMALTSAALTYSDSLIITGDTGSGFITIGHSTSLLGTAWFTYSFAGQSLGMSDPTTIPVTFGVPLDVHWQLNAQGGCTGDGTCNSGFATTGLSVVNITRADGSASTGRLTTLDSVPEPSTFLLIALGGSAILVSRFRRA
jgi:hypothetical protein